MDLVIIEGLDITINLAEIALMKAIKVDNPHYIPAIPHMEVKEQVIILDFKVMIQLLI